MNHVSISLGSSGELRTCVDVAQRFAFVTPQLAGALMDANDEINRMLYGLYNALEQKVAAEEAAKQAKGRRCATTGNPDPELDPDPDL